MDFPGYSTKKNSINYNKDLDNEKLPILIPGPQGPKGDKGDTGPQGIPGPKGEKGNDGYSTSSKYGQNIGWSYYYSDQDNFIQVGLDRGIDEWVSIGFKNRSLIKNEQYLPYGSASFWNEDGKKINFRSMKIGTKVDIRYDLLIDISYNYTEAHLRTYFNLADKGISSYIGLFKYKSLYDISVYQTVFLSDFQIWSSGGIPQIKTDTQCMVSLKGIYVSSS